MAKTKRTTQAEPATTRPTMAGLQAQIDELNKTLLEFIKGTHEWDDSISKDIRANSEQNAQLAELAATTNQNVSLFVDGFETKLKQLETQLAQSIASQGKIVIDQSKLAGDLGLQITDLRNLLTGIESKSLHSAKLQADVNDEIKAKIAQQETEFDGAENRIDILRDRIDKLEAKQSTKSGGGWLNWIPVGVVAIAIAVFAIGQRGCSHGSPKPAPDEFEQSIVEPSKAKKLAGSVIMLIDRDPMTDAVLNLETAAEAYKLEHEGFEFRTYDYQDDKSAKVANYINKAKEKGVDPPLMIHLLDGKVSFAPAAKDWAGVVKVFGK